ncbi:MAG: preprotein translocase subunit SecG [Phycisphaerales bacterium]
MIALLGLAPWVTAMMVVAFLFLSVCMILVILIQRPQGGGLAGAFGSSAGSGQTAFGARTGDALTIATITVFVLFLLMACGLNFAVRPSAAGPAIPAATSAPQPVEGAGAGTTTPPATTNETAPVENTQPPAQPAPEQPAETTPAPPAGSEAGGEPKPQ